MPPLPEFPQVWERNLPHTIEAVFFEWKAKEDQKVHARDVHSQILRHYRLQWQQLPLLEYNPDGHPAFSLAP